LNPTSKPIKGMERLKSTGLSDRTILDATLIIGYFNFVNRIVLLLGVEENSNKITAYKYD